MKYTPFKVTPGQVYDHPVGKLVLIPKASDSQIAHIGEILEGSGGWTRTCNENVIPEDYVSVGKNMYWSFTPLESQLVAESYSKEPNYQIY